MRTLLTRLSVMLPALLIASLACAQAPYPTKPIRLIVPYPPAGTTDFVAREVAYRLGEAFGQQIVIDNRPGAGTLIGLTLGAKAPPDGYTITFGTSAGLAVNPALGVKMPYEPLRDFVPIGLMVYVGVEATPGAPAAFRELIVSETERWRKVIKSAGITAEAAQ